MIFVVPSRAEKPRRAPSHVVPRPPLVPSRECCSGSALPVCSRCSRSSLFAWACSGGPYLVTSQHQPNHANKKASLLQTEHKRQVIWPYCVSLETRSQESQKKKKKKPAGSAKARVAPRDFAPVYTTIVPVIVLVFAPSRSFPSSMSSSSPTLQRQRS